LQQGHRGLVHKWVIPRTELSGAVQSFQPLYPDFGPILVEEKLALESFKIYLLALTQGCIATDLRIESVGLFLASFAGTKGISGTQGTLDEKGKSLEKQRIAVS